MAVEVTEPKSLEYTPTWVVATVCFVIVLISLLVERLLHHLGKFLKREKQDALFEALQKLKEELMLLGFISLLLTVFQGLISHICIPEHLTDNMLPCKKETASSKPVIHNEKVFSPAITWNGRRLLASGGGTEHCAKKGKAQLLSLEALHQLHIFIFVLAVVHVIFCATTMFLGRLRIQQWKLWEHAIRQKPITQGRDSASGTTGHAKDSVHTEHVHHHLDFFRKRATGFWRKSVIICFMMSFCKQFYGSVTKSDYIALRLGFIMTHCPSNPNYNFYSYMIRTLEIDFKKVVGISWYLWLFVVIFLLLNVQGWHTYFWMSFLPLILLLVVGAKLEHIITQLAEEVSENKVNNHVVATVKPSDKYFWLGRPGIVLYLIHFILFQNAFEIAFFFWIWSTYGFNSCILEKVGYIVPRLIIGVLIQVLCSYSTLPLYVIVTQMGSMFKEGIFDETIQSSLQLWLEDTKRDRKSGIGSSHQRHGSQGEMEMQQMAIDTLGSAHTVELSPAILEESTTQLTELPESNRTQISADSNKYIRDASICL